MSSHSQKEENCAAIKVVLEDTEFEIRSPPSLIPRNRSSKDLSNHHYYYCVAIAFSSLDAFFLCFWKEKRIWGTQNYLWNHFYGHFTSSFILWRILSNEKCFLELYATMRFPFSMYKNINIFLYFLDTKLINTVT